MYDEGHLWQVLRKPPSTLVRSIQSKSSTETWEDEKYLESPGKRSGPSYGDIIVRKEFWMWTGVNEIISRLGRIFWDVPNKTLSGGK